jgi:hypothetical protein
MCQPLALIRQFDHAPCSLSINVTARNECILGDLSTLEQLFTRDITTASDTVFANCSKAKLGKKLWTEALLDAQKVR